MPIYVIRQGQSELVRMPCTYARRSQSTLRTLVWRDRAIIEAESKTAAIQFAGEYINSWIAGSPHLKTSRWAIEGRGFAFWQEINLINNE
jgi:hypothetical protein